MWASSKRTAAGRRHYEELPGAVVSVNAVSSSATAKKKARIEEEAKNDSGEGQEQKNALNSISFRPCYCISCL